MVRKEGIHGPFSLATQDKEYNQFWSYELCYLNCWWQISSLVWIIDRIYLTLSVFRPIKIQREVAFYSGHQPEMKSNQFQKAIRSNESRTFVITAFIAKTAQNTKKTVIYITEGPYILEISNHPHPTSFKGFRFQAAFFGAITILCTNHEVVSLTFPSKRCFQPSCDKSLSFFILALLSTPTLPTTKHCRIIILLSISILISNKHPHVGSIFAAIFWQVLDRINVLA